MRLSTIYTGELFYCYMLDASIYHFSDVGSIWSLLIYFLWKILLAKNVGPEQMPDLGLHCLPMTFLRISR